MKFIKDIGQRRQGKRNYLFGLFECPTCLTIVEKIKKDGLAAESCSHKCYSKNRHGQKRGSYVDFVIISGYRYIYVPEHPKSIGTRELYVAEHRLVMESIIGRYLTDKEIVHHKNGDTLDNSPSNLEMMTTSDHAKLHIKDGKRSNNGKLTV